MTVDFAAINLAALPRLLSLAQEIDAGAKPEGSEILLRNPRRTDNRSGSFSINASTGVWSDFACSESGGDVVSWWAYCRNLQQGQAAQDLAERFGLSQAAVKPVDDRKGQWIRHARADAPAPRFHWRPGFTLTQSWEVRDAGYQLIGYRVRFDNPEEKKIVLWWTWRRWADGREGWHCAAPDAPSPLYGLDRLEVTPDAPVLICEGEKAADAAEQLMPGWVAVTSGSCSSASSADWTPLAGRHCVIWPDRDQPGRTYASNAAAMLRAAGCASVSVIAPPEGPDDGWDASDAFTEGWDAPQTLDLIHSAEQRNAEPVHAASEALSVLRWSDFKGRQIPPPEFTVEQILPRVTLGIIAGNPGHGKSILTVQLAIALAAGLPVLGFSCVGPMGVGILALEDGENTIQRRVQAAVASYGHEWTSEHDRLLDANLRLMVRRRQELEELAGPARDMALPGLVHELGANLTSTEAPAGLLFIDTLNAVHPGDENSAQETRLLINACLHLNGTLGVSVWLIHHLRKSGLGRNAPSLADRLDPELLRGSTAFVGATRAVVQLGWITRSEAEKVQLDGEGAHRRYAILGLTKANDAPLSPWLLLEHSEHAGLWVPVPRGDEILASLKGSQATLDLSRAESILLDAKKGLKHAELAAKHYPGDPKADSKLKTQLNALRGRHGWLQRGSLELTAKGFLKAQELSTQAEEAVHLDGEL